MFFNGCSSPRAVLPVQGVSAGNIADFIWFIGICASAALSGLGSHKAQLIFGQHLPVRSHEGRPSSCAGCHGISCNRFWSVRMAPAVTGWRLWHGLLLELAESVVSLVASLSGQNLVSVHDLYKQEGTCEYSFGLVFFQSGMATHSYATRLAWLTRWFSLSLPVVYQRPEAALREAPPNSDVSEGNE